MDEAALPPAAKETWLRPAPAELGGWHSHSRRIRSRITAVAAAFAFGTTTVGGGCTALPDDRPPVSPPSAKSAVETALGVPLYKTHAPDTPQLVNVLATYAGGRDRRHALVVVFDSPSATRQIIGSSMPMQVRGVATVAEANVVVLFQPPHLSDKALVLERLRRALR
jgi:hypothetical protein